MMVSRNKVCLYGIVAISVVLVLYMYYRMNQMQRELEESKSASDAPPAHASEGVPSLLDLLGSLTTRGGRPSAPSARATSSPEKVSSNASLPSGEVLASSNATSPPGKALASRNATPPPRKASASSNATSPPRKASASTDAAADVVAELMCCEIDSDGDSAASDAATAETPPGTNELVDLTGEARAFGIGVDELEEAEVEHAHPTIVDGAFGAESMRAQVDSDGDSAAGDAATDEAPLAASERIDLSGEARAFVVGADGASGAESTRAQVDSDAATAEAPLESPLETNECLGLPG